MGKSNSPIKSSPAGPVQDTQRDENYYSILGVEPGVSKSLLRPAYHVAARKAQALQVAQQPDAEMPPTMSTTPNDNLMAVTEAFRVLSDDWQRSVYDLMGHHGYLAWNRHIATFAAQLLEGKIVRELPRYEEPEDIPPLPPSSCGCFPSKRKAAVPVVKRSMKRDDRMFLRLSPDHEELVLTKANPRASVLLNQNSLANTPSLHVKDVFKVGGEGDIICIDSRSGRLEFRPASGESAQQLRILLSLLHIHMQKNKSWLSKFYQVTLHSHADSLSLI